MSRDARRRPLLLNIRLACSGTWIVGEARSQGRKGQSQDSSAERDPYIARMHDVPAHRRFTGLARPCQDDRRELGSGLPEDRLEGASDMRWR